MRMKNLGKEVGSLPPDGCERRGIKTKKAPRGQQKGGKNNSKFEKSYLILIPTWRGKNV